jgi:hypothetical protein
MIFCDFFTVKYSKKSYKTSCIIISKKLKVNRVERTNRRRDIGTMSEDEDESASAANQVINPQTKSFVGIFIILIVHFCQMISFIFFVFVKDIQRN